ncbi:HNH endonuclease [Staphylococcus gallinarum]|uniref:NUMOD4 domain-containing protein n=1 Tax=Staphylococcus gallinarum TaxID=1293 RepID=UPI0022815831|nr:HNH endonuclease [Staphylococcus gallinarum]MDN6414808.1 HNH endonuclease [Staphylococcus gallinarum]
MVEVWKDVGETNYQVSSKGNVRNKRTDRILAQWIHDGRYKRVSFNGKGHRVHRLVALYFIDNPLNKEEVNHIDGNKFNNNVENLEWVTGEENNNHALKENINFRPLSKEKVINIYNYYRSNKNIKEVCNRFNISRSTLYQIRTKRTYKDYLEHV